MSAVDAGCRKKTRLQTYALSLLNTSCTGRRLSQHLYYPFYKLRVSFLCLPHAQNILVPFIPLLLEKRNSFETRQELYVLCCWLHTYTQHAWMHSCIHAIHPFKFLVCAVPPTNHQCQIEHLWALLCKCGKQLKDPSFFSFSVSGPCHDGTPYHTHRIIIM